MPNVMAALPNAGRALCSTPQFGWRLLVECRSVTLPRRKTRWNLLGCPKLTKRSQSLVGRSLPQYKDMWERYYCLTSLFPIVDTCLSCEDIARQSCAMVLRWRFFAQFLRPVLPASRVQHISDLHSKFALGPHHCGSMVAHVTLCWWRLSSPPRKGTQQPPSTFQLYCSGPYPRRPSLYP